MIGRVYTLRGEHWWVIARGVPFDRGPRRNVLVERVERVRSQLAAERDLSHDDSLVVDSRTYLLWRRTGKRMVRPFRGMRRP